MIFLRALLVWLLLAAPACAQLTLTGVGPSVAGGAVAPADSASRDFINGIYKNNGITSANWPTSLTDIGSTFTRSSAGNFGTTSAGSLTSFGSGVARITDIGLLYEPTATNLALQSNAFTTSPWAPLNSAVVTAAAFTSPDGTNDGFSITAGSATGVLQGQGALLAVPYVSSFWAKTITPGSNGYILQIGSSATNGGNPLPLTTTLTRYSGVLTAGAGFNNTFFFTPGVAGLTGIFGAQTELAAASGYFATNPSSLITTTSAAGVRAADAFTDNILPTLVSATAIFDNATTQTFSSLAHPFLLPTAINRPQIKSLVYAVAGQQVQGDHQFFTKGPFSSWLDPFNAGAKLFTEWALIKSATFPAQAQLSWGFPAGVPSGIMGYLQIASYGDYEGTVPETPITPLQVNSISTLSISHGLSFTGTTNGYDVAYDLWLTSVAGDNTHNVFEVEIFLHTPAYTASLVAGATPIGTTTISGINWTVAQSPGAVPDIYFMPTSQADIPSATLDLKAMLLYLKSQSVITGSEWYNGHGLGVEPAQGGGSLTVNSAAVVFN